MKIFIDGEHGTTGLQIKQRLAERSGVEVISIEESKRHDKELRQQNLRDADFAILCLPDEAAKEAVEMVGEANTRIIDASSAHRTNDDWVYGFIELEPGHKEKIREAKRVSNPGCYATATIAMVRPLVRAGILKSEAKLTINAISGYSGGGKKLIEEMESEGAVPHFLYGLDMNHKHIPEIKKHGLLKATPIFLPSVGNFKQGMAVQLPLHIGAKKIKEALKEHYKDSKQIEVNESTKNQLPTALNGTDKMQITVSGEEQRTVITTTLDNLGKGASGACLQSLELMMQN